MNIGTVVRDTIAQVTGGLLTGTVIDMLPFAAPNSVNTGNVLKAAAEIVAVGAIGSFVAYNWMDMMRKRGFYSGADSANLLIFYASALASMPKTSAKLNAFGNGVSGIISNSFFTEGLPATKIPNQDNTAGVEVQTNLNHGTPDNNPATAQVHEEDFGLPITLDM